jgi:manganese/zinc/iron transport system ATP- binding protein
MRAPRIILLLSLAALGLPCAALGQAPAPGKDPEPLRVVATTGMIADTARVIGGPAVQVTALMGEGVDPHLYKASPGDVRLMTGAGVLLWNGLHLEGRLGDAITKLGARVPVVCVTDSIPPDRLLRPAGSGAEPDPHVWFDLGLWGSVSTRIRDAIIDRAPGAADAVRARCTEHLARLDEAARHVKATIASVPADRRVLVTAHDAFGYFGRAYGLEEQRAAQGRRGARRGLRRARPCGDDRGRTVERCDRSRRHRAGNPCRDGRARCRGDRARARRHRARQAGGARGVARGCEGIEAMTGFAAEFRDVAVAYRGTPAIVGVDASIPAGSLCAVVGPNGAGKSTLLKAALGLVPLASGSIELLGQPAARVRGEIGYVPQRESVDWDFPVSALEVVMMGSYARLGWLRRPGRAERGFAMECLDQVQLTARADRQISQLSGGEQQRVFIARALMQRARLYLMDEPFSGVDAATEQAIVRVLDGLRRGGCTVVAVHHDLHSVRRHFDHVLLLNTRLVAAGPVDTTFTTEALQRTYGGRLMILDGTQAAAQADAQPVAMDH